MDTEKRKTAAKPDDFDLYTKGLDSPSKNTRRFKGTHDPNATSYSGKWAAGDLMGDDYEQKLQEEELRKK